MVFVFGIDIPLVELIFVLTLTLIGLLGMLIYVVIKQHQLNKRLEIVLSKENVELKSLKDISKEEKSELKLLRLIRTELSQLLYSEEFYKKIESLLKKKKAKTKKEQIKTISNYVLSELIKARKTLRKSRSRRRTKRYGFPKEGGVKLEGVLYRK